MPPRLTKEVKKKICYQYLSAPSTPPPTAHSIWVWTRSSQGQNTLGCSPSKNAITNLITKLRDNNNDVELATCDKPRDQTTRSGKRAPISQRTKDIVVQRATNTNRKDHERRARGLAKIPHNGRTLSEKAIRGILKESNLKYYPPRSKITLKPHHRQCRTRWATKWKEKQWPYWKKFCFSDEKIFRMFSKKHSRNGGLWLTATNPTEEELEQVDSPQIRDSQKICAWGAIGYWGKSQLLLFSNDLTEQYYKETIIDQYAKPFMDSHEGMKVFVQDGDPKHTAKGTQNHLTATFGDTGWTHPPPVPCKKKDSNGNWVLKETTCKDGKVRKYKMDAEICDCAIPEAYIQMAKSPDANIIENLWAVMVERMRTQQLPNTLEDFKTLIVSTWDSIELDYIQKLYHSMPNRFLKIEKAKGRLTKY